MIRQVFALVDCDNFFVSCERVFRPDLWGKPVVVLSNNDGCIVARSNEVKALGVPMGVPYFKVRDVLTKNNVQLFSANFSLYGDFSQRVVRMLEDASPRVEVYSVDESFLEISSLSVDNYEQWALELRAKIWKWLGIPVSIGIAPTKTLAKAAAEYAKHAPDLGGAFSLMPDAVLSAAAVDLRRHTLLRAMPITAVWGVGWRTAPKLQNRGLSTAYDLSLVSDAWARQQLTIKGLGTVKELQGEPWFMVEDDPKPQQSLAVTRTFPSRVRSTYELETRIAGFTAKAAQKLRRYEQVAGSVAVFIAGDRHKDGDNYRRVSTVVPLVQPSSDTGILLQAALKALETLYDPDFSYRRAGVVMHELASAEATQLSWLSPHSPDKIARKSTLLKAVDALNTKHHTRLIWHAIEQAAPPSRRVTHRSPSYTTHWKSLPKIQ